MELVKNIECRIQKLSDRLSGIQLLSGNSVKIIAILAMMVDHLCKIVLAWAISNIYFPLYEQGTLSWEKFKALDYFIRFTLQGVGTIAFPLFCFLLSEGFYYTKNRKRYISMMLVFAVISEIPFDIGFFRDYSMNMGTYPFYWAYQNVFFTLFLGLAALYFIDKFSCNEKNRSQKIKSILLQICSIGTMMGLSILLHSDYGSQGIIFIVGFYICRKNRIYQILMFLVFYMITTGNQPTMFILISALIIMLYNGNHGKLQLKYFFYLFYPIHIILLYWVTVFLERFFII